jgi:thiamine-monophosphate kinase
MPRRLRTLSEIGESALIARIARRAGHAPNTDWPLGIGDDAAILRPRAGSDLVLSTDAQVENVHFRFGREMPRTVGRRALAVNLSDLAAMGATPVGCLLSLAVPADLGLNVFDALIDGIVAEGERYACPLVGGNLARAEDCSLHVTVVGRIVRGRALLRGRLRPGDELFVTGVLGSAALARQRADLLGTRHARVPVPRLEAGSRLARSKATTACIDLSDGLATDLAHLLEGSGLGARVELDELPVARRFVRDCADLGLDPKRLMLEGGEDYELLFARRVGRRGREIGRLEADFGIRLTRIGRVVDRPGIEGLPPTSGQGHHF